MLMLLGTVLAADTSDLADLAHLAKLPERAQALRDDGLDGFEVSELLTVLQASELPRKEVVDLLAHASILVKEHGPIADFSGFVKKEIGDGKRGAVLHRALTEAHEGKADAAPAKPAPAPAKPKTTAPRPKTVAPPPRSTKGVGSKRGTKGVGGRR